MNNIEKQDRERSEKETDLDGKALGKNEKELLVIDDLSYEGHNIVVICDKFINWSLKNSKICRQRFGQKNPNIVEIPKIPENQMEQKCPKIWVYLAWVFISKIPGKMLLQ